MKAVITALTLLGALASTHAYSDSCAPLVRDFKAHIQSNGYIRYQMAVVKQPARWVAHQAGIITLGGIGLKSNSDEQVFSDRNSTTIFNQYFAADKADKTTVELNDAGQLKVTLNSWGNGSTLMNTTCTNGFVYGIAGDKLYSLTFKKDRVD